MRVVTCSLTIFTQVEIPALSAVIPRPNDRGHPTLVTDVAVVSKLIDFDRFLGQPLGLGGTWVEPVVVQVRLDECWCVTLDLVLNYLLHLHFKFLGHFPCSFALTALVALVPWLETGAVAFEAGQVYFLFGGGNAFWEVKVRFFFLLLNITNQDFCGLRWVNIQKRLRLNN